MIKMRDTYHADISNDFNVRVYSTEPPEGHRRETVSTFLCNNYIKNDCEENLLFFTDKYINSVKFF